MKSRLKMTEELVRAAAWDAANASMRKAGRSKWSREDQSVYCQTFDRLGMAHLPAEAKLRLFGILPAETPAVVIGKTSTAKG